jgi:hypothetical protein
MTRVFTYALAIAICLGATAVLSTSDHNAKQSPDTEAGLAADGAFRDGQYLGNLAAQSGQPLRPAVGRWSRERDRSMFTAGYLRGYSETVARANAAGAESTE